MKASAVGLRFHTFSRISIMFSQRKGQSLFSYSCSQMRFNSREMLKIKDLHGEFQSHRGERWIAEHFSLQAEILMRISNAFVLHKAESLFLNT